MTKRISILVVAAAFLLAACGSSSGSDGAASGGSDGAKTTEAGTDTDTDAGSGDCAGDLADAEGFVRAFCDGTATVSYDIGGTTGTIEGGECIESGGFFTVNAGVLTNNDYADAAPDYAGFLLPTEAGDFGADGITASITTGGEGVIIQGVSGTHDADGGSFEGTTLGDDKPVSVTFTC